MKIYIESAKEELPHMSISGIQGEKDIPEIILKNKQNNLIEFTIGPKDSDIMELPNIEGLPQKSEKKDIYDQIIEQRNNIQNECEERGEQKRTQKKNIKEYGKDFPYPEEILFDEKYVLPKQIKWNNIGDKKQQITGQRNDGNTCFLNSILQCLQHLPILVQWQQITSTEYAKTASENRIQEYIEIRDRQRKDLDTNKQKILNLNELYKLRKNLYSENTLYKINTTTISYDVDTLELCELDPHKNLCYLASNSKFCFLCAIQRLCLQLYTTPNTSLSSKKYQHQHQHQQRMNIINANFLAKKVYNVMHDRSYFNSQQDAHECLMVLLDRMHMSWLYSIFNTTQLRNIPLSIQNTSPIYSILSGWLQNTIHCLQCNTKTNTYEQFLDLSLEITSSTSILQSLQQFTSIESLYDKNAYACDICKTKVSAEKSIKLHKLPNVLCISLKRFKLTNTSYMGYQDSCKVHHYVEYPLELDILPYISSSSNMIIDKEYYIYNLTSIIVHVGNLYGGHYYAYIQSQDNQWYRMDDEDVQNVSLQEVLQQKVYMLFYNKKKLSIPILNGEYILHRYILPNSIPSYNTIPTRTFLHSIDLDNSTIYQLKIILEYLKELHREQQDNTSSLILDKVKYIDDDDSGAIITTSNENDSIKEEIYNENQTDIKLQEEYDSKILSQDSLEMSNTSDLSEINIPKQILNNNNSNSAKIDTIENKVIKKYMPWDGNDIKKIESIDTWDTIDSKKLEEYTILSNKEIPQIPGYSRDQYDSLLDKGKISKIGKKKKRAERDENFWDTFGKSDSNPFQKVVNRGDSHDQSSSQKHKT